MRQRGRRNTRGPVQEVRDRWMITYADLITLLLIFFVILYAMSSLDGNKYGIVTDSLSQTFGSGNPALDGGTGILDPAQGQTPASNSGAAVGQSSGNASGGSTGNHSGSVTGGSAGSEQSPTGTGEGPGISGQSPAGSGAAAEDPEEIAEPTARELAFKEQETQLAELVGVITKYVQDNNLEDQIFVEDKPQGIAITLSDRFLFDVGDAALKSPSLPALQKLSGLFNGIGAVVSIEGHTDNTSVLSSSEYKDNWELSGARALSVLRFFLEKQNLNPDEFQYAGYADTRPASSNTTEAGRQKNRRVEIIVLRQLQEVE
ncbi:OmpA/MotB family protein [Paenibacillus wynnii]|uniref:Flagellar motor protein n=1 Tax=Paenibacillus wynnii TaxID=268407 RepID=A0A098MEK9_9BACL|nr:flagellar motor protein MotB [Paenibacillus wynnii]KGE20473.1 flagellar motor protein [Paenibacillus wynnii]